MIHRSLTVIAIVAFGLAASGARPAAAATPGSAAPKQYYLALGDSLAFGFQQVRFNANLPTVPPTAFNTGYVDDLSTMLRAVQPNIVTFNYGCPGETSSTFLVGGCPYTSVPYRFSLHNPYPGSQMQAALDFLTAHPGQVSPITLDIGTNDVENMVQKCQGYKTTSLPCVFSGLPGTLGQVSRNLNKILGELRAAAPSSQIIVMQYYNPIAVDASLAAPSDAIVLALNAVIAQAALSHGARLADAFPAFNLGPQPQTLCTLTLICTAVQDIHPSDAGYQVIAQQFWAASGYGRLAR